MFTPFAFVKQEAGAAPSPYTRNIVTRGLLNYIDAGLTASYPGTGTVWYDLTPNGYNWNQVGSPVWNSAGLNSYFQMQPSNNFTNSAAAIYGISLLPQFTMCLIIEANNGYGDGDIWGTGAGQQGSILFMLFSGANGMRGHVWMNSGVNVIDQGGIAFPNSKAMASYAVDWTGGNCKLWEKAVLKRTQTLTGTIPTILGVSLANLCSRGSGGGTFNGRFYAVLLYDTLLTDAEISQNWNAF